MKQVLLNCIHPFKQIDYCSVIQCSEDLRFLFSFVSRKFYLELSSGVRVLPGGVFGDVTFELIFIHLSGLRSIDPAALLPMKDRLRTVYVINGVMEEFPWETIPQLENLQELNLYRKRFRPVDRRFEARVSRCSTSLTTESLDLRLGGLCQV